MTGGPLAQTTGDRSRRRRRWPWVLLIVLLLLVIAAAAYGLVRAMGAGGVAVPTVVGTSKAAALTKLEEAGFKAGVQEEYSDKYGAGLVSRQAPPGGTKLRKGDTVDIWVSKGSETVTLAGLHRVDSGEGPGVSRQERAHRPPEVGQDRSGPVGQVFKQDPPAGSTVKRGDTITYWVSSGKPQAIGPRSQRPDAGRSPDGPGRRRSAARHGHAGAEHDGAERRGHPPGPDGRRHGGEGVRREHRRVERSAVAVARAPRHRRWLSPTC